MAAPMWIMRLVKYQTKQSLIGNELCRRYMSRYRRRSVAVLSPEDEIKKIAYNDNIKVRNQKRDRDIYSVQNDPVLDNLSRATQYDKRAERQTRGRQSVVSGMLMSNRSRFNKRTHRANLSIDKTPEFERNDEIVSYRKQRHGKPNVDTQALDKEEENATLKPQKSKKSVKFKPVDKNEDKTFYWDLDGMKYSILKDGDKKFGAALKNTKSKNHRDKIGQILLEGRRLIEDALMAGGSMLALFFTHDDALLDLTYRDFNAPIYKVFKRHMNIWSDTVTPPGLLAIFEMPGQGHIFHKDRKTIPLTLILDNIRDPGNMGTIIRTAAAVGCQNVITVKGCVDMWDPKVLRSAAGSHFRVPLYNSIPWEDTMQFLKESSTIYVSDKRRPTETRLKSYKFSSQEKLQELVSLQEEDYIDEDEELQSSNPDENFVSKKNKGLYLNAPMNVETYNKVDFAKKDNIILVVGGEVHGVSAEARKLAFEHYGECLTIPMCQGVESLNAGIAGSILMYEIHRQFLEKREHMADNVEMGGTESDNGM